MPVSVPGTPENVSYSLSEPVSGVPGTDSGTQTRNAVLRARARYRYRYRITGAYLEVDMIIDASIATL